MGTGRRLSDRLVSSAVIYYLSISQCGRKKEDEDEDAGVTEGGGARRGGGWEVGDGNQRNHSKKVTINPGSPR